MAEYRAEGLVFVGSASPETCLWASVLRRALEDLDLPLERSGALAWFQAGATGPGSFRFVCDALGFEADYLRRLAVARAEGGESLRDAA